MTDSEALIQHLLNPTAYPHRCERTELIETHISWVVLTGNYAYKIKKPVDLGFADFSSLDKRRHFCEEELRLNRRLAPDMYLDVLPVTGTALHPQLDGSGEPIEYAVQMTQFDQSKLLSRMIGRQEVSAAHIDDLAANVAAFHGGIAVARASTDFGSPSSVTRQVLANFEGLADAVPEASKSRVLALQDWSRCRSAELHAAFEQRCSGGMVRECHGDMHLGNMFLDGERVVVFDGIEFNDDLRWIDIISDVAFLIMDLEDRGRLDLAHRCLNKWLEDTGDYEGLQLLPFYQAYRAMVRAKVDVIRLQQGHLRPADSHHLSADCEGYLRLADQYIETRRAALMITSGVSGSGKTTGTEEVVEQLGAIRVRSDVERKRLHGLGQLASSQGTIYSEAETKQTYDRLAELAVSIVKAGFPVLLDATFLKHEQRAAFRHLAATQNVPFCILHFEASEPQLRRRIQERQRAGNDASEADLHVLAQQLRYAEVPAAAELHDTISVAANAESLTEKIRRHVQL